MERRDRIGTKDECRVVHDPTEVQDKQMWFLGITWKTRTLGRKFVPNSTLRLHKIRDNVRLSECDQLRMHGEL